MAMLAALAPMMASAGTAIGEGAGAAGSAIGSAASSLGSSVMSGLGAMGHMTGVTPFLDGLKGMGAAGTGSIAGPPTPGSTLSALGGGHPLMNLLLQGFGEAQGGGQGGGPRPPAPMQLGSRQSPPMIQGPMTLGAQGGAQRRPVTIGSQAPVSLGV